MQSVKLIGVLVLSASFLLIASAHELNNVRIESDNMTDEQVNEWAQNENLDPDIKEWHFHTYFFQTNRNSSDAALKLWDKIQKAIEDKYFVVVPLRINWEPVGPHLIGSYETWVPKEYFAEAMSFFMLNRGDLSVLLHPLTRHEVIDHTTRAMWLGKSMPLDLSPLSDELDHVPLQYPELGLGYSAK